MSDDKRNKTTERKMLTMVITSMGDRNIPVVTAVAGDSNRIKNNFAVEGAIKASETPDYCYGGVNHFGCNRHYSEAMS